MQSSDPQHFFETDAAQAKRERQSTKAGNKYGNPVALKSKLLAAIVDPRSPSSSVIVVESAGTVRTVNVDDGEAKVVYRGPKAPVTCAAVGGPDNQTLFAGSWDKAVWSWDLGSAAAGRKYVGHSDFVKAVACAKLGDKHVLFSGGADKKIIVWDVATGARLHTLQDSTVSMLAVQDLVIDPAHTTPDEVVLVSAGSDPHIRRWKVRLDGWEQVAEGTPDAPGAADRHTILEHETSVYKLAFDVEGDDVDLWTSSADGTAKCLSRLKGFTSEETLQHGDHVRAVAVTEQWIITAGRDEDIKFWDRTSGRLSCSLEGHYDEVTDLVVLGGSRVCSVSIDGTVRTWPLAKDELEGLVKQQSHATTGGGAQEPVADQADVLTADEEAELAELMEDDD